MKFSDLKENDLEYIKMIYYQKSIMYLQEQLGDGGRKKWDFLKNTKHYQKT